MLNLLIAAVGTSAVLTGLYALITLPDEWRRERRTRPEHPSLTGDIFAVFSTAVLTRVGVLVASVAVIVVVILHNLN